MHLRCGQSALLIDVIDSGQYLFNMTANWDYIIVYKPRLSELQEELNKYGKEGWEAVSMERSAFNNSCSALIKRPRKE